MFKRKYSEGWIDYPGVERFTDGDVAKLIKDHTHWWDRLDYHKVSDCSIAAQLILMKVVEPPKKKKWQRKWYF